MCSGLPVVKYQAKIEVQIQTKFFNPLFSYLCYARNCLRGRLIEDILIGILPLPNPTPFPHVIRCQHWRDPPPPPFLTDDIIFERSHTLYLHGLSRSHDYTDTNPASRDRTRGLLTRSLALYQMSYRI